MSNEKILSPSKRKRASRYENSSSEEEGSSPLKRPNLRDDGIVRQLQLELDTCRNEISSLSSSVDELKNEVRRLTTMIGDHEFRGTWRMQFICPMNRGD